MHAVAQNLRGGYLLEVLFSEGSQYEAFKGKVTNNYNSNYAIAIGDYWWERSVNPGYSVSFLFVGSDGDASGNNGDAAYSYCVCLAWCFLFRYLG